MEKNPDTTDFASPFELHCKIRYHCTGVTRQSAFTYIVFFEVIVCLHTTAERLVQTRFQGLSFHDARKRKTLETRLLPTTSPQS